MNDLDRALAYHSRTRHHPNRYARALGYMDWDTQPDPFRRYDGAPTLPLALCPPGAEPDEPRYEPSFVEGLLPAAPLDARFVARLFRDSLGLSAWKVFGDARWSLRVNPSSGNLHPTEGYLICGPVPGLSERGGVFHYAPRDHLLEERLAMRPSWWASLTTGLPEGAVLVGFSAIHWRESWKYGERAFRYCQHDLGHALAAVTIAAAGMGWSPRLLEGLTDDDLAALLGIADADGPEAERPDALLALAPRPFDADGWTFPAGLAEALRAAPFAGVPARLSADHHPWPIIDEVDAATRRRAPARFPAHARPDNPALEIGDSPLPLRRILHQRRSAVDMDGHSALTLDAFIQLLLKVVPGQGQVPFETLPWAPAVDLLLFVHRVADLDPGLYALVRSDEAALRGALDPAFTWVTPSGCPEGLPLRRLQTADVRAAAAGVSCGQAIASDGAFAVAMVADLRGTMEALGAWMYKRLHWEAGLIGQVLYLEAEASGARATGIGCFFDAPSQRVFGLAGDDRQVLYHFTVGGPVEDPRLQTEPPYGHLSDAGRR
ncbi:MAG: SagB/ThcOx family dehydrogenase [Alphaproteobacteria bacterium]|nr:SagB/ThcOx family dehydrogenase [Alphaproteobacteria bacterium]